MRERRLELRLECAAHRRVRPPCRLVAATSRIPREDAMGDPHSDVVGVLCLGLPARPGSCGPNSSSMDASACSARSRPRGILRRRGGDRRRRVCASDVFRRQQSRKTRRKGPTSRNCDLDRNELVCLRRRGGRCGRRVPGRKTPTGRASCRGGVQPYAPPLTCTIVLAFSGASRTATSRLRAGRPRRAVARGSRDRSRLRRRSSGPCLLRRA